jgi:WbqC-like protein family
MQPYFLPYAGYFRLMCRVDAFVVFDNVQFPRRGWVHRNRLRRPDGELDWLTLPLRYHPLDTWISALEFDNHAQARWRTRMCRFPACRQPRGDSEAIVELMDRLEDRPSDYLRKLLRRVADILGLSASFVNPADLSIPGQMGRTERVIAICRAVGATTYVNAPGGRFLYEPREFAHHGIKLVFLPDYRGTMASILQRLHDEPAQAVRREIESNLG